MLDQARFDDLAFKLSKDGAFAIEKAAVDSYGPGSGVGCRHPSGLAKSDADRAIDINVCLSLGYAEREKGQQNGDEH